MPKHAYKGQEIAVDEDGFLVRFEDWTESLARELAKQEGIAELSEEKLAMLRFLRQYYIKNRFFPILRSVCSSIGWARNCMTEVFKDPVTAWKIAGLPNPGEEVLEFRSWEPLGF